MREALCYFAATGRRIVNGLQVEHTPMQSHSDMPSQSHTETINHDKHGRPYLMLLLSTAASYVVMYFIMYAMADRLGNVYLNLSNVYMTGLMAGSMLPIMLLAMPGMFKNKKLNVAVWAGSVVFLALCWFLLRAEAGVGDRQFLRAMIPHHSAAIQMARESDVTDPRIKKLAEEIITSQEREIAEMRAILDEGR